MISPKDRGFYRLIFFLFLLSVTILFFGIGGLQPASITPLPTEAIAIFENISKSNQEIAENTEFIPNIANSLEELKQDLDEERKQRKLNDRITLIIVISALILPIVLAWVGWSKKTKKAIKNKIKNKIKNWLNR